MQVLLILFAICEGSIEVLPVPLETPPFGYEPGRQAEEADPSAMPELVLISSTPNGATDYGDWFDRFPGWPAVTFHNGGSNDEIRGATPPRGIPRVLRTPGDGRFHLYQVINDQEGTLVTYGDPPNQYDIILQPRLLAYFDPDGGGFPLVLDFLTYAHGPGDSDSEADFTFQQIRWADVSDGILYISHAHRTYSESSGGMNAFVTALDIETFELLWRSEPLVANSENFVLLGDAIISGYGFTDEDDFLYVLDRFTGEIVDEIPVPSAPEYLIVDGGRLYVRCSGTDLVFSIR